MVRAYLAVLLFSSGIVFAQAPGTVETAPRLGCHSISFESELSAGQRFEKAINKQLIFRVDPYRLVPQGDINSWEISLVRSDDPTRDYIYPVNPPLRFNGVQVLGPAYGADTATALASPHRMRFLLSRKDDERLWPLVTNALWPYSAPQPDKAGAEYVRILQSLETGELSLEVLSYNVDPQTGSIQRLRFRATFTAPERFRFFSALGPTPDSCKLPSGNHPRSSLPRRPPGMR
jgi:hypothetical protein